MARSKRKKRSGNYTSPNENYSGIGGQAVIEGIMMKKDDKYAVAVRTPSGDIDVTLEEYDSFVTSQTLLKVPFIRGVFSFIDSLLLGIKVLNYSANFYEEEDKAKQIERRKKGYKGKAKEKFIDRLLGDNADKILAGITVLISLIFAIALFMLTPYFLSQLFKLVIVNRTVIAIIEGILRVLIFVLYVVVISMMKDIKRVYKYHAAEHKCINCLESGKILNVENVRRSSRIHKRCGTSFMFFVIFVSVILFMFIREEDPIMRVLIRILLLPVISGISYEFIRFAGNHDNKFIDFISAPGMLLQKLTTCELDGFDAKVADSDKRFSDDDIIEVAITAVDYVFDWRTYLIEHHNYTMEDFYVQPADSGIYD